MEMELFNFLRQSRPLAEMLREIITRHNPSIHMGQIGQSDLPEEVCKIGHGTVNTRERMWQERGCHKRVREDLAHETASIRIHLRRQARKTYRWRRGASRARAAAKLSTNSTASELYLPPVSMAITTKRHLSPKSNSAYFLSLSTRAPARHTSE